MPDSRELIDEGLRYQRNGALDRALDRFEAAAEAARAAAAPALLAEALRRAASVHRARCDWDRALDDARRSGEVAREAGLPDALAEALNAEAAVHQVRGEFAEAARLLERIISVTGDHRIRAIALQNLGTIAAQQGRLEQAERCFRDALDGYRQAGYRWGEASALSNYSATLLDRGEFAQAEPLLARAVELAREVDDQEMLAIATKNYAEALAGLADFDRAQDYASTALGYFSSAGNRWRAVECYELLGDIHARRGDPATAAECYEHGLRLAERIDAPRDRERLSARLAALRDAR